MEILKLISLNLLQDTNFNFANGADALKQAEY